MSAMVGGCVQVLDQLAVGARKSRGAGNAAPALTGQAWYQQQALRWEHRSRTHTLCMPAVSSFKQDAVAQRTFTSHAGANI